MKKILLVFIMTLVLMLASCGLFGSDDEDGDPINGDPTNGEVDNGDNGDNGDPTNGEVDNGDNGDNGDIETGLLAEFAHLSTLDNYTISMIMDSEFENIDVNIKYYEEFVYMVDFFNSRMKFIFDGESPIQDLEDQIKAEHGQTAVDIMDFWAEKIIYSNAYVVNSYYSMLLYDDIALFVDDMFTEDGDTFTLSASKFDDYILNIFIWDIVANHISQPNVLPQHLEGYLENWFDDTDVQFPGMDPDDLRTAFAQVFAAEHDELLGTLISHEITVKNNDITVVYAFNADGFAFTLTIVYEAFDTTTINTEQDLNYQKILHDFSIMYPWIIDLAFLDISAEMYCEQEPVNCDIGDILTIDELGQIIDYFVGSAGSFVRMDGDFLIEIIGEDHYRIAYETQVGSITYRYVGDSSVFEEVDTMSDVIKLFPWFVKDDDSGFADYEIDFLTPALPPTDTNPNP